MSSNNITIKTTIRNLLQRVLGGKLLRKSYKVMNLIFILYSFFIPVNHEMAVFMIFPASLEVRLNF